MSRPARIFRNLARSLGVVGTPDPRELEFVRALQPVVQVDRYDPPPMFVWEFFVGAPGVNRFATAELFHPTMPWRLIRLHNGDTVAGDQVYVMGTRINDQPGNMALQTPTLAWNPSGETPLLRIRSGDISGGQFAANINQIGLDQSTHIEIGAVVAPGIRWVISSLAANVAFDVTVFWEELGQPGHQDSAA